MDKAILAFKSIGSFHSGLRCKAIVQSSITARMPSMSHYIFSASKKIRRPPLMRPFVKISPALLSVELFLPTELKLAWDHHLLLTYSYTHHFFLF